MKRALITGVTGQDGAYLAEYLLGKGYDVHGIKRRSSSLNTGRADLSERANHQYTLWPLAILEMWRERWLA